MPVKFTATCLNTDQIKVCHSLGIEVIENYANSYGEISANCITNYSVHCFNSQALEVLKNLGVKRATLHPELNLAQIRDIAKPIETEIIIYGKIPLMKLGNPQLSGVISDRKDVEFYAKNGVIYNSVPIFMADKLNEIEKSGVTHGRLIFTTETSEDTKAIIKAYMYRKSLKIPFTRGKFYSRV